MPPSDDAKFATLLVYDNRRRGWPDRGRVFAANSLQIQQTAAAPDTPAREFEPGQNVPTGLFGGRAGCYQSAGTLPRPQRDFCR
jgi:hypothetical protein